MVFKKINLKTILPLQPLEQFVLSALYFIFQKLLIGDGAPLRVIQDTASLLGDGAIPALTLIIRGNQIKGLYPWNYHFVLFGFVVVVGMAVQPLFLPSLRLTPTGGIAGGSWYFYVGFRVWSVPTTMVALAGSSSPPL
ncbi:hypothetical protein C1H46_019519 [Malus baccata]|uniref:Uncharacterized protein n=1 Tax=Malus baccata TaxID=106549 RepID=A0A540M819_MALBA|nr:hypothetical protein C1H46_019519 [Malus baccata]